MTFHPEDDEFSPRTEKEVEYVRKQQNPYAKLSLGHQGSALSSRTEQAATKSEREPTASKRDFELECRRILGYYVPEAEQGRLRPHFKAFISRNLSRTPPVRHKILSQLRKYDLSNMPIMRSHFNREQHELTEAKLRDIEHAAGIEE